MAKLSTPKDYAYKKLIRGAKNACLSEWRCHPVFLIGY
jgi:hypothetical protein